MALLAHELIDQVLHRVRDPQGVVASRAFVLDMLSKAQQLVNAKLAFVLDETPLVTEPLRCFYPIRSLLPQSQTVMFVTVGNKDLLRVPWRGFWAMKRGWPREVAEQMQLWSLVGRDVLVLWPSRRVATTVTVKSAKLTTPLVNEQSVPDLPDDVLPLVVDLAEVLVLLKMRKADMAGEAMTMLHGRIVARE